MRTTAQRRALAAIAAALATAAALVPAIAVPAHALAPVVPLATAPVLTKVVGKGTPASCTETALYNDAVEHLCRLVDDKDRQLIELRLQGCSTAEVARRLNLDPDILRVRLSRLRKRLREQNVLPEWI